MGLRVACFGKLPFYREFIRHGCESPAAAGVVRWIERAHEAMTRAGTPTDTPGAEVTFALPHPEGAGVVAGVVRRSSDGLRRHPVALFAEDRASGLETQWHLAPIALAPLWRALAGLLEGPYENVAQLGAALDASDVTIGVPDAVAAWEAFLSGATADGPWRTLTGVDGDAGRHLALNLVAVARAQRDADSVEAGVSFAVPLAGDDAGARLARAGLWLAAFREGAGTAPPPAILLAAGGTRLYAFYRPVDGADLGALLTSGDTRAVDDLTDAWQTLPPADPVLARALDAIVAPDAVPLGDLPARVRAASSA